MDIETEQRHLRSEKRRMLKKWYKYVFGDDYIKIYAHRDEREAKLHVDAASRMLGVEKNDTILDLGCGFGRHSFLLAEKGVRIVGFDLSIVLLGKAIKSLNKRNLNLHFVNGDMRYLPFYKAFDKVMSFFTSFGYFEEDWENEQVINGISRALKDGGLFWFDYFNSEHTIENLIPQSKFVQNGTTISQERNYNTQNHRIEKRIILKDNDGVREYFESVRAYSYEQIKEFFNKVGLTIIASYGDYTGEPLSFKSPRLILIGKKDENN